MFLKYKKYLTNFFYFAAGLSLLVSIVLVVWLLQKTDGNILGLHWCNGISPCTEGPQPPVTVTAFIRIVDVKFTVYPEKREPAIGNWATIADVRLQDCNNSNNFTYNAIVTNSIGKGTVVIPSSNPLPEGDYRFFIRGYSHLNEEFNCYTLDTIGPDIDLTLEGKELLAGEVSNSYDNYVNSLDMSVLIGKLFTNDYKSDLNQDTLVNGLDFGNQIYNLFKNGD